MSLIKKVQMINNSAQNQFNGLYIHLPFCHQKCFYCSFVVSVGHENKIDDYLGCLEKEAETHQGEPVTSIYLGGGTPTLLDAAQLDKLCGMIRSVFQLSAENLEWTIEGNPEKLSSDKIRILKDHGVNRFSLGIQSLNDKHLKYLGRNHDADTAVKTFHRLREEGVRNISTDLMFGFPDQTIEELKEDIKRIAALGSEHLSLYALTIEEKTRFHTRNVKLPNDIVQAEFYSVVMEELRRVGFSQYEISNFAKPGFESQHNINYWMSGNYIGLGVGAHAHRDGRRYWNGSNVFQYMQKVREGQSPVEGEEILTSQQRLGEAMIFGLRMNQGIDMAELQNRYQVVLEDSKQERLEKFIAEGLLYREENQLCATDQGRLVLDEIAVYLV